MAIIPFFYASMTTNITYEKTDQPETVDGVPASIRNCKSCVHAPVCEARRTLYRSFTQFEKEFGDFIDIGVIHNEKDSVIDLLAKSCKHYKSPTTEIGGR